MNEDKPHRFIVNKRDPEHCTFCGGTRERRYQYDHDWWDLQNNRRYRVSKGDLMHSPRKHAVR